MATNNATKTASQWASEYAWDTTKSAFSYGAEWATAGAAMGGWIGGLIGGGLGIIFGGLFSNNKSKIDKYQNEQRQYRKETTRERNQMIIASNLLISNTRSTFDSKYGKGMFDQYDDIFMNILGQPASSSLSDLFSNMQIDKVSGVINSRLAGKVSDDVLSSSLNVTDINETYLEYLKEQLRAQRNTAFGISMQTETMKDQYAWESYYDQVSQQSLQYAQQFESAFMSNRQENISGQQSMGEASLAQATSGIRQEGSGTTLTAMQQFQNDLSSVAQASVLKKQMQMAGLELENLQSNQIYNSYVIRQGMRQSTQQQLDSLVSAYNEYHGSATQYYIGMVDREAAVDQFNANISEAERGRKGLWNHDRGYNREYIEEMDNYL